MRTLFFSITLAALISPGITDASAAASKNLDSAGYIRDWIMLAPIPLPERGMAGDLLLKEQIEDENKLNPKDGDTIKVAGKELTWKHITASTNYFDFNVILDSLNDRAVGYMVTYVECPQEMPDVMMSVGSYDQGRIYFNGVDIYAFTDARPLEIDADKGKVTLKKGRNVIIFKIINEQNSWQGSMRLTDLSGHPLRGLKIGVAP